jgi:pimeloyl-ACP methyl ester carboxylesterase
MAGAEVGAGGSGVTGSRGRWLVETPGFVQAGEHTVLAVLTHPTGKPNGRAVVFVPAGGGLPWVNRDRFPVLPARRLAGSGYHAARFDYRGSGESTGWVERYSIDRLFTEEVEGVIAWVRAHGLERLVLVGFCYGARTALAAAQDLPGLERLILISGPPYDDPGSRYAERWGGGEYVRRALRFRALRGLLRAEDRRRYLRLVGAKFRAVSRRGSADLRRSRSAFVRSLARLVDRRVPVLLIYGEEDVEYHDLTRSWDAVGPVIEGSGSLIELQLVPGRVHAFDQIATQDALSDRISAFLARAQETALAPSISED